MLLGRQKVYNYTDTEPKWNSCYTAYKYVFIWTLLDNLSTETVRQCATPFGYETLWPEVTT